MPKEKTHLKVFIASPSDLQDERQLMPKIINDVNQYIIDKGIYLDLLMYEKDTYPSFDGKDAQDIINSQIGNDYDIFIGIMWGRFGEPTPRAGSGTEEEFNLALERLKKKNEQVMIMFYFKNEGIPPSEIDAEQIKRIHDFKSRIEKNYGGLYHSFETISDFEDKVKKHLILVVDTWGKKSIKQQSISGKELDLQLFEEFKKVLPSNGSIELMRNHDFHNVFSIDELQDLNKFNNEWDNAEHEFMDQILEDIRKKLFLKIEKFIYDSGMMTSPTKHGMQTVMTGIDTELNISESTKKDIEILNNSGDEIYELHQEIIRTGRRLLYA